MSRPQPNAPACPHCGATMKHVRTIAHLAELPEVRIFYCAPWQYVDTVKQKRAA